MIELKTTMNLNDFEQYCSDIQRQDGLGWQHLYAVSEVKKKVMVDVVYRIVEDTPQQLEFDFGEQSD